MNDRVWTESDLIDLSILTNGARLDLSTVVSRRIRINLEIDEMFMDWVSEVSGNIIGHASLAVLTRNGRQIVANVMCKHASSAWMLASVLARTIDEVAIEQILCTIKQEKG